MSDRVCPSCSTPVKLITDTDYPQYGWCSICEQWVIHVQK